MSVLRNWATVAVAASALALGGCSSDAVEDDDAGKTRGEICASSGKTLGAVLVFGTFARETQPGVAEGLNVDELVSSGEDADSCFKQDYVSPDGLEGVDNQFATLLPLIEAFVGTENIDAILEGAIANGQLLIVMGIEGVDDTVNDDCVNVLLGQGMGTPLLDTEGNYELYQTFGFDQSEEGVPVSRIEGGVIRDGVLEAGPGDVVLPVRALDAAFELNIANAYMRLQLQPEPLVGGVHMQGVTAGGVNVEEFKSIIKELNIGDDVIGAATSLIGTAADLQPDQDGVCTEVSAGLRFETVPAYVIDEN